jgi:Nucleotide-diphospho-sugar transferase
MEALEVYKSPFQKFRLGGTVAVDAGTFDCCLVLGEDPAFEVAVRDIYGEIPALEADTKRNMLMRVNHPDALSALLKSGDIKDVKQMILTVRTPEEDWDAYFDAFEELNKTHLLVHAHGDNRHGVVEVDGAPLPVQLTLTYIRLTDLPHGERPGLMSAMMPTIFDRAADLTRPEIELSCWPWTIWNIEWFAVWSERYQPFAKILRNCFSTMSPFKMNLVEKPQAEFDATSYQIADKHFLAGMTIKSEFVNKLVSSNRLAEGEWFIFSDVDNWVNEDRLLPVIGHAIRTAGDRDIWFMPESQETHNIGFMLMRNTPRLRQLWASVVACHKAYPDMADQDIVNAVVRELKMPYGVFPVADVTSTAAYVPGTRPAVIQILCPATSIRDRNILHKLKQYRDLFGCNLEKEIAEYEGRLAAFGEPGPAFKPDSVVQAVLDKFIDRARIGKEKYGATLDREDLSPLEWIQHAQEEHMDAILYLEKLKRVLSGKS